MNAKGMKKNSFHQEEPPLGLMVKKISHNSAPLKKRSLLCNLPDGQKTTTTTTVREREREAEKCYFSRSRYRRRRRRCESH